MQRALLLLTFFVTFTVATSGQQSKQPVANEVAKQNSGTSETQQAPTCPEAEDLKSKVRQMSIEIQQLKSKVARYEKERLATTLQEELEREQDRAERFQLHLIEISEKEAPLQARLDQINQQLKPESLDRTLAGVGSVHPEDLRDGTQKALQSERYRLLAQLELHRQDRARTQTSLGTTDAAIARIKQKLLEALK